MTGLALALLLAAGGDGAAVRLEAANARYLAGDFEGAAAAYGALLAEGFESPALHHNLGNARLRLGQRGLAAASFERALRLDPGDADTRANLALARAGNVDRVLGAAEAPLLARLVERTPDAAAAAGLALAWAAFWLALGLRARAPGRARASLAAAAIAAALGAGASGALVAGRAAERRRPAGVVVAASTPVRDGPEPALRPAFELHEGTRVRLLERRGDVARVRLENGLEGWVAAGDLEVL